MFTHNTPCMQDYLKRQLCCQLGCMFLNKSGLSVSPLVSCSCVGPFIPSGAEPTKSMCTQTHMYGMQNTK